MRRVGAFVPMETEIRREVPELATGSSKRDAEEELDQGSSKRQKTSENSEPAGESKEKEDDELSQEELQQLMIIVPEEGMNVEALQTKYPIINWEVYTEDSRMYWKTIRVGNHTEVELKRLFEPDVDDELWKSQKHVHDITWRLYDTCGVHHVSTKDGIDIYMLVEKEYPLSRGVLTQMFASKLLVEQNNEMSRELHRKIYMMAERPRRWRWGCEDGASMMADEDGGVGGGDDRGDVDVVTVMRWWCASVWSPEHGQNLAGCWRRKRGGGKWRLGL
ncbi:hypothetical protein Tco_1378074 [Tanacetum coccineum]